MTFDLDFGRRVHALLPTSVHYVPFPEQRAWTYEVLFNVSSQLDDGSVIIQQRTLLDFISFFISSGMSACV